MENIQGTVSKGIVVDVLKDENKVLVLMRDGSMQKVIPHRPYKIGEEIAFKERIVTKKVINWSRVVSCASGLVAAAAIALYFTNIPFISDLHRSIDTKDVYAKMYIESKSDVEVDLNRNQEVIDLTPLNKPAKRVIRELDWEDKQVSEFVNEYFQVAKEEGYLGAEDKAIISINLVKSESDDALKEIKTVINKSPFIKENALQVLTVVIPDEIVKKAEELGVTPGKFSILLAAKSAGEKNIPPVNMLNMVAVTELIDANPIVAKILPNYSEEELAKLAEQEQNNTSTTSTLSENSQPATTTTQSNQSTSNEVKTESGSETNNAVTQNEASEPSEDTQTTSGSVENQTNSTDSTEQTQTASSGSASQDSSDSSTKTKSDEIESKSEQTPSQTDNEQPPASQEEGQDQNTDTNKETPSEEPNTPPSDQPEEPNTPSSDQKPSDQPSDQQPSDQPSDQQPSDKEPTVIDQIVAFVKGLTR